MIIYVIWTFHPNAKTKMNKNIKTKKIQTNRCVMIKLGWSAILAHELIFYNKLIKSTDN